MTMSFFGKLKPRHTGPPAPPRRTDNNAGFGWPEDEFDDDADTYEPPPCERPAMKVPQRPVEENVYLDRTSNPGVPQRQAAPPPRPSKLSKPQQREDATTKPPPAVDRNDKPGRKMMPPPSAPRSPPAPAPFEEDVYLDPNEEQEDDDDLYLEPTAACPPTTRGPMKIPLPTKTPAPAPMPMMKPVVPRTMSNFVLPPLTEFSPLRPTGSPAMPTGPSVEDRHHTFPPKPPPPTPSTKPSLPVNLKETKASPPNPPVADTKPVASYGGTRATKLTGIEGKEWFAGDCSRKTAEDLLQRINKDGAFLIRYSSAQSTRQPYTLAVLYQQKVYNIPIRFLVEMQSYALGKEGKKNEEIFNSLDEMISHHKYNQLLLIDSKSQAKHTAHLTHPVRP